MLSACAVKACRVARPGYVAMVNMVTGNQRTGLLNVGWEGGLLRRPPHDAQGWEPCACSSRQAAPCKCWHSLSILPFTWSSGLSIGDVETDSSEKNCECVD